MKQYISFGPSAGICNRIKRLFSALRFNVDYNKPLDLYWSTGDLTNHHFYELFTFDMFEFNEIPCEVKINIEDEYDVAANIVWRLDIKDGEVPKGFTQSFKKDDESKEYIDLEYNRIPRNIIDIYLPYFQALHPSKIVQEKIDSVIMPSKCVSVHIRQGRFWNEYNRGSRDSVDVFIEKMKTYEEDTYFFLAAASDTVSMRINDAFPNRIIELPNKSFTDAVDAVAELYLLGKTEELIATYGSTFSEVAWWLGDCKQKVTVIGSEEDWGIKCPVCSGKSKCLRSYSRNNIMERYRDLYAEIPGDLEIVDYNIMLCEKCGLVFSNPMKSASRSFSLWNITKEKNCIEKNISLEYREICEYVKRNSIKKILCIGDEAEQFIEFLKMEIELETHVITTENAIYNSEMEKLALSGEYKFDLIIAFHVLEVVEHPLDFMKDAISLLNAEGKCMSTLTYFDSAISKRLSTPNYMPPHQLTRWGIDAIQELADTIGVGVELVALESASEKSDVWNLIQNEYGNRELGKELSVLAIIWKMLKHPRWTRDIMTIEKQKKNIMLADHIGGEKRMCRPPKAVLAVFEK